MSKKGFTLIEMIAAVVIIGIISAIVAVSFKNVMNKNKETRFKEFKRELEQAACASIDLTVNQAFKDTCYGSGVCNIDVGMLIKDGLISEKLVDPRTDEVADRSMKVSVVWTTDSQTGALKKTCVLNTGD